MQDARRSPRTTSWSCTTSWRGPPRRPNGPTSTHAWGSSRALREAPLPARCIAARVDRVAVEEVLFEVDPLARQLPAPEIPEDLQVVVYLCEALAVIGVRVVRTLSRQESLALLRELPYLAHNTLCHPHLLPYGS